MRVGVNVPATVSYPYSDYLKPDGYFIMNIDFTGTYFLAGFEFYAVKDGSVDTLVSSFFKGYVRDFRRF